MYEKLGIEPNPVKSYPRIVSQSRVAASEQGGESALPSDRLSRFCRRKALLLNVAEENGKHSEPQIPGFAGELQKLHEP